MTLITQNGVIDNAKDCNHDSSSAIQASGARPERGNNDQSGMGPCDQGQDECWKRKPATAADADLFGSAALPTNNTIPIPRRSDDHGEGRLVSQGTAGVAGGADAARHLIHKCVLEWRVRHGSQGLRCSDRCGLPLRLITGGWIRGILRVAGAQNGKLMWKMAILNGVLQTSGESLS